MARRQTNAEPQRPARLVISKQLAEHEIQKRIDYGRSLAGRMISNPQELKLLREDTKIWSEGNAALLLQIFDNNDAAIKYGQDNNSFAMGYARHLEQQVDQQRKHIDKYITNLRSVVGSLPFIEEPPPSTSSQQAPSLQQQAPSLPPAQPKSKKVFIVHGHDDSLKNAVARVVTDLGLVPVILSEQPNAGKTVIEKFEANADVWFAVVLLTPDDKGASTADSADASKLRNRARQNVILELGYFIGKLGRANVCALHKGNIELPSDIIGVVYTPVDNGDWRLQLGKELQEAGKKAGIRVNLNKLA